MTADDLPGWAHEEVGATASLPAAPGGPPESNRYIAPGPDGVGDLARRWWVVVRHPSVATFDRQQADARWTVIWLSLLPLALTDALGVVYVLYGPDAAAGYSSLPIGPKLHLPPTPLLPLVAFVGSVAQFFGFVGVLQLSACLIGGHGAFKTQAYLIALFWVPLMLVSDTIELVPVIGSITGPLIRLYALCLCGLALASGQRVALGRAWMALLLPVAGGLLLGLVVLLFVWTHLHGLVPIS